MDMRIFQVKSNKALPHAGSILIASPLLYDYRFSRTVILIITHDTEGSMGIVLNKTLNHCISLNQLVPELREVAEIPIYRGGPMDTDTIFFLHTFEFLEGALPIGNGLYMNGNFELLIKYIRKGHPVEGKIKFFAGYAGWENEQLKKEIDGNTWFVGESDKQRILESNYSTLWKQSMHDMGTPYRMWARYPMFPSLN